MRALVPLLLLASACTPAAPPSPGPAPTPVAVAAPSPMEPAPGRPVALPAEFVADRIFVRPVMVDGRPLRLYTDTGGGTQFLHPPAVERLGFSVRTIEADGEKLSLTPIPAWRAEASIPPPLAIHQPPELKTHYLVLDEAFDEGDGFLGQGWFGGRTWTFDYAARKLLWRAAGDFPAHASSDAIPLHLPRAQDGLPTMHFGRVTVLVDGEPIDLLFDTGATLTLTPEALATLGDGGPATRGTSFIARNVFERWRSRHPEWRVVADAERRTGFAIIEVPRVSIAAHEVGPVWFTFRKDESFHAFMSSMMDARVEGALGGSALRYFRVTADFAQGKVVFQRP
ncbi:hypothetical protein WME98_28625 [Sorangium sp. So ce296]|uniref:hypothetical protein n=1 Tax=Sorangium sp. So ce296 TaxID=3133296 RepID=UPI003F5E3C43